jgi:hypothetical protein
MGKPRPSRPGVVVASHLRAPSHPRRLENRTSKTRIVVLLGQHGTDQADQGGPVGAPL